MGSEERWRQEEAARGDTPTLVWVSPELNQVLPRAGGCQQVESQEKVLDAVNRGLSGLLIEPMTQPGEADMGVRIQTNQLTQAAAVWTFAQGAKREADRLVALEGMRGGMEGVCVHRVGQDHDTPPNLWPIYTDFSWQKGTSNLARIEVANRIINPKTEWLMSAGAGGWRAVVRAETDMRDMESKMEQRQQERDRALRSSATEVTLWLRHMAGSDEGRVVLKKMFMPRLDGPVFDQNIVRMADETLGVGKIMVAFTNWFKEQGVYYLGGKGWRFGEGSRFNTNIPIGEMTEELAKLPFWVDFYKKEKGGSRWMFGIETGGWRQLAIRRMMKTYGL